MGAFLEKPKTEKTTTQGEGSNGIKYGVSAMQGWRMEMEDAHVCNTSFVLNEYGFFGVFDGHAGPNVSKYCSNHLLDCILECIPFEKDKEVSLDALKKGIHEGFLLIDSRLRREWETSDDRSGTTAIVAMVTPTKIIWANCGDSRGIFCRDEKVYFATTDHKPFHQSEKERIEKAGGTVMMQRVNGSLAVSRALGDFDYKRTTELPPTEQLVSPEPEITVIERDLNSDQFLLLACDGIFDVMSNTEVVDYVLHHLKLTGDLTQICSDLIDTCLNKNSRDNMSVVLVTFPGAPSVSEEAIREDEKLQEEAKVEIEKRIQGMALSASDPLELEDSYVIQKLTIELPVNYDVVGKRPFISDMLNTLVTEKFSNRHSGEDFSGPSDASEAPSNLLISVGGSNFVITPETDSSDPTFTVEANATSDTSSLLSDKTPAATEKEDESTHKELSSNKT